jgi:Zn-dependent M16 (insulinase) family peptidase
MHQKVINGLFPSHGYGHVVSGMPNEILKLTLKDVRAYHAKYFQPNNCSVYTYGDFPVDDTLKRLDDILTRIFPGKNVVFPPVTINVGDEPPWAEGRQQVCSKCILHRITDILIKAIP